MCFGTNCPRKASCYRATANVNPFRQAYFVGVPFKPDGSCDEYWASEVLSQTKKPASRKGTK